MLTNKKVNWIDMFPDEFFDARDSCPVCYMAYGLAEPHGVHNALGMDWVSTQMTLELVASNHGGIVAPPFAWHIQEQQYYDWEIDCCGMGISLSSSLPEDLFLHNILYHIRNIDTKGFHAGILVSGHCLGRLGHDMRLLCDYYKRRTGSPIQLWAGFFYELFDNEKRALGLDEQDGHHAGIAETAQLMALKPESVDLGRLNKPLNVPVEIAGGNDKYGPYCSPKNFGRSGRLPTREIGQRIVDGRVRRLGEISRELLANYKPKENRKVPSIIDTEAIWTRFVQLTRKYWGSVLTEKEAGEGIFPVFPGWDELGE